MNHKFIGSVIFSAFIISGCYTKFASYDSLYEGDRVAYVDSLNDSSSLSLIDSIAGDSLSAKTRIVSRVDTIIQKENEICVWERDFTGYPHLRCFPSNYSSNWYFYNNSPWWFRNSTQWYDYKRCPKYYYYDPECGCCNYYGHHGYTHRPPQKPSNGGGNSGGGSSTSSGSPNRSRVINKVVRPVQQSNQALPKSNEPVKSNSTSTISKQPVRERSIGSSGSGIVRPIKEQESAVQKKTSSVPYSAPAIKVDQPHQQFKSDSSGLIQRSRSNRNSRW